MKHVCNNTLFFSIFDLYSNKLQLLLVPSYTPGRQNASKLLHVKCTKKNLRKKIKLKINLLTTVSVWIYLCRTKSGDYTVYCNLSMFMGFWFMSVYHSCICAFQIQNVGSGMCMEVKHFVSGSPIRLENCVKGRGEVGWSHGQVRAPS